MFMLSNVFESTNLDLCKNRKFCFVPEPRPVYNSHKDIKQFICAETLLSAVSLSFREIYGFPFILHFPLPPSFIVPCQIFTVSFFIFLHPQLFSAEHFQLVRFPFFFSIISFLLFQTFLVAKQNINNWNRSGMLRAQQWIHEITFGVALSEAH